jgi:hypothetical protein
MNGINWSNLAAVCSKYNSQDEVFDSADIQDAKQREFPKLRTIIESRLNQITAQGRFK